MGKKEINVLMQEDTGASCTIISTTMWKKLGKPVLQKYQGRALRSYDGTALKIVGTLSLALFYEKRYHVVSVRVVESDKCFGLLGRDIMISEVHSASEDKISANLGAIRNATASLNMPEGVRPIFCNVREVPLPLQEQVTAELNRMETMGVISQVPDGGSEWASPLVCARKADGSLRLCCDYKVTINRHLMNDAYHPPDMETIFSKLGGAKLFAKFEQAKTITANKQKSPRDHHERFFSLEGGKYRLKEKTLVNNIPAAK